MDAVRDWWRRSLEVVTTPGPFYDAEDPAEEYRSPLRFASISAAVPAVILAAIGVLGDLAAPLDAVTGGIGVALFLYLTGMYLFVIRVAVTDTLLRLVNGEDMTRTMDALAAASILTVTLGWIPGVNIIAGIYAIYVESRGLQAFNDVSMPVAVTAILVGSLLAVAVGVVVIGIVGGVVNGVAAVAA